MTHPIVQQDLDAIAQGLGSSVRKLSGKTLLVSGGCGFLGSYFTATIQHLNAGVLQKAANVIVLDSHITSKTNNLIVDITDDNIEFRQHDVRHMPEISVATDYIVHMAGIASPAYYMKYPLETIESAVWGARNLLDLAVTKRPESFLFFSSSEIYGDPDPKHVPMKEEYRGNVSCTGPRACYDESKRLAETLCMTYHQRYGVPVKWVRPFNVYGPGMRPDDYRVVPTFLSKAFQGASLPVHGKGDQTRSFCYASDAMTGFFQVLLHGRNGEPYNVGNDEAEVSMVQLARTISATFGGRPKVQLIDYPDSYPADEPQRRAPELTKARNEVGYRPKVPLSEGLRRTVDWFRDAHISTNDAKPTKAAKRAVGVN